MLGLCLFVGGFHLLTVLGIVLYATFGNPSQEFWEELKNYHPPGHE